MSCSCDFNITNPGNLSALGWPPGGWSYLDSEEGKSFSVETVSSTPVFWDQFRSTQLFSDFLQLDSMSNMEANITTSPSKQPNPFKLVEDQFEMIRKLFNIDCRSYN